MSGRNSDNPHLANVHTFADKKREGRSTAQAFKLQRYYVG
jgi:hypothetical protein